MPAGVVQTFALAAFTAIDAVAAARVIAVKLITAFTIAERLSDCWFA
jgi:hypothetical protein